MELAIRIPDPSLLAAQEAFLTSMKARHLGFPVPPSQPERNAWNVLLHQLERALPAATVSRVYLGSEFCPFLLASPEQMERAARLAVGAGFAVSVVLPVLHEKHLARAQAVVEAVAGRCPDAEVVANDLGSLALFSRAGLNTVAGRLLFRMKRLPRFSEATLPAPLPLEVEADPHDIRAAQLRELSEFMVDSPRVTALLERLSVSRFDTEMLPQGMRFGSRGSVACSLHMPMSYVTGGGECPVARLSTSRGVTRCGRACRRTVIEPRYGEPTWRIQQYGHTVFTFMTPLLDHYLGLTRFDRYVLTCGLPM